MSPRQTGSPGVHGRVDAQPAAVGEDDVDAAVARLDFDVDARLAEQHRALQLEAAARAGARNCPEILRLRMLWT